MLVQLTIGSAWNILRHLQNFEDHVETSNPSNRDESADTLAEHTVKDIQAEIEGVKHSILLSNETNTDRLNMLALAKATQIVMGEYRHVMGDETPEINDVYKALEPFKEQLS